MVDLLFTSEYYNLEYLKKKRPQLSTLMWDLGYCYRSWTCQISKLVPKFQEWSSCCNYLDGAENWKSTWTLYRLSTKSAVICLSVQETLTCKLRWKLAAEQGFLSQVTHGCLARGILKLCYHVSQKYWAKVGCSWEKCLNTEQCFLLQKKLSDIKKGSCCQGVQSHLLETVWTFLFLFFAFFPPPYIILSDKQSLKILDVHSSLSSCQECTTSSEMHGKMGSLPERLGKADSLPPFHCMKCQPLMGTVSSHQTLFSLSFWMVRKIVDADVNTGSWLQHCGKCLGMLMGLN